MAEFSFISTYPVCSWPGRKWVSHICPYCLLRQGMLKSSIRQEASYTSCLLLFLSELALSTKLIHRLPFDFYSFGSILQINSSTREGDEQSLSFSKFSADSVLNYTDIVLSSVCFEILENTLNRKTSLHAQAHPNFPLVLRHWTPVLFSAGKGYQDWKRKWGLVVPLSVQTSVFSYTCVNIIILCFICFNGNIIMRDTLQVYLGRSPGIFSFLYLSSIRKTQIIWAEFI